jgi:L-lysine 2,3-aminomutase
MSKRSALMKKLVKLKHKVEKTTPYYVGTKSNVEKENPEDNIISEFIINNKEIKKMTKKLKSMRTMRKPSLFSNLTKKKLLKGKRVCND